MPRKNKAQPHSQFQFVNHEEGKKRFTTKREAENAAEYQMLLKPDLELFVYQSELDRGWYLTRKDSSRQGT